MAGARMRISPLDLRTLLAGAGASVCHISNPCCPIVNVPGRSRGAVRTWASIGDVEISKPWVRVAGCTCVVALYWV